MDHLQGHQLLFLPRRYEILTRRLRMKLEPNLDSPPQGLFERLLDVRHNALNLSHSQNHNYYFFSTHQVDKLLLFFMRLKTFSQYINGLLTGF